MLTSIKIRALFIDFFKKNGHQHFPASNIANNNDPHLLFTNAGMNQFKELFCNPELAPTKRIVTHQPCLRVSGKHNDLDEVGVDTYHHTLFEMLGNWSFGDYQREEAIKLAWELLIDIYKLPQERIYVTVFGGDGEAGLPKDDESVKIWGNYINPDRILFFGKKDNFWEMGDFGPCGPCSEIHIDVREEEEIRKQPGRLLVNTGHPQVIEIWNLVFIEYNRLSTEHLQKLSNVSIDTGMGFERLTMVLSNKRSTYDTDIFLPIIHNIMRLSSKKYGREPQIDIAIRVIADHIRALTFAIADGVLPDNIQEGYVIRRILRRAVRYGYTYLNFTKPFLYELVPILARQFKDIYPQIQSRKNFIVQTIQKEETNFFKTLSIGIEKLESIIETLHKGKKKLIPGQVAFELYDTYGFPIDLTKLIAQEKGIAVEEDVYEKKLEEQRMRSKKNTKQAYGEWQVIIEGNKTNFIGYDHLVCTTKLMRWRSLQDKDEKIYQIVLMQTPFYPQGGGQVGDTGKLIIAGKEILVIDTKKEGELILHYTKELPEDLKADIKAIVDNEKREKIANNHTATHLLQAALRQVLGEHVIQKGSLINENQLRFDFRHDEKLNKDQIQEVERIVNKCIRENLTLKETRNVPIADAKKMGAVGLFEEKYGDYVRVITFGKQFSNELCGGTHAVVTGKLGFFKIITETASASGIRRIEAVTAEAAEKFVEEQTNTLQDIMALLKYPSNIPKTISQLIEERNTLAKKLAAFQAKEIKILMDDLKNRVQRIGNLKLITAYVEVPTVELLKHLVISFKDANSMNDKADDFVVAIATNIDSKPHIAVFISNSLVNHYHMDANAMIREAAQCIQGAGGGNPCFATAKGIHLEGIDAAFACIRSICKQKVKTLDQQKEATEI